MRRSLLSGFFLFTIILAITIMVPDSMAQRIRLSRQEKELVQTKLSMLTSPVTVHIYTGGRGRGKTEETLALLELMKNTSSMISVVEHDMDQNESVKGDLGVSYGPVMALKGEKFFGISYYGYPALLELAPFLDGILIASGNLSPLSPQTSSFLVKLDQDVHLRVFVTPD